MKRHLKYRNLRSEVQEAAKAAFDARPGANPAVRQEVANTFLSAVSGLYSVDIPMFSLTNDRWGSSRAQYNPRMMRPLAAGGHEVYRQPTILLRKWSLLGLFEGFRLHLIENGAEHRGQSSDDALNWACSLFFAVRPATFRKLVARGKVDGMSTRDFYKDETWSRMVNLGVVDYRGRLSVPNFRVSMLDDLDAGTVTLDELQNPVEAEDESVLAFVGDDDGIQTFTEEQECEGTGEPMEAIEVPLGEVGELIQESLAHPENLVRRDPETITHEQLAESSRIAQEADQNARFTPPTPDVVATAILSQEDRIDAHSRVAGFNVDTSPVRPLRRYLTQQGVTGAWDMTRDQINEYLMSNDPVAVDA